VNRRVLESLIRVGALNALGHPAQLLMALDDALSAGQAAQRDRLTGQVSLFDSSADSGPLERALPEGITEAAPRERLRWEKELLGLYLSDHPLGELAGTIGDYVNAYSGEMGEELDQQRVVIGGVVTEVRRVITKARATMGVATLEDLQGTIEVIVFPKVFELTEQTWAEDSILLVAGRVDHKGDETVLLADSVWTWEQATALGPQAFGREVARGDRGRRGGASTGAGNGRGYGNGNGYANRNGSNGVGSVGGQAPAEVAASSAGGAVAVGPGPVKPGPRLLGTVPRVSPLRGGGVDWTLDVYLGGPPIATPTAVAALVAPPDSEEPQLPDEAVRELLSRERAPTVPLQASAGQSMHVTLLLGSQDDLLSAMRNLRELFHGRPGETPVVIHFPVGGGRNQRMEIPIRVAYDAELVSSIGRLVGPNSVEIRMGA
jgi:hypothetical protein